jgi:hypothetical protein
VTQFHQARERQTFLRRLRTRLIEKGDASASRRFIGDYGGIFELKAERRFDELHSSRYRHVETS